MFEDLSGDTISVANDAARLAWNDTLEALMAHAAAEVFLDIDENGRPVQ